MKLKRRQKILQFVEILAILDVLELSPRKFFTDFFAAGASDE